MISALPGYLRNAASNTSTWLESMERGKEVTPDTSSKTFSIICFSSMPLIPMLISSISAPQASCSSANCRTISRLPSLNCSCNFFFPVGLILSPIIRKRSSKPNSIVFLSDDKNLFSGFFLWRISICFVRAQSFSIYSGAVPQQPPRMEAPASTRHAIPSAKASLSISYTVFPSPSKAGRPAFGLAITGTDVASAIVRMISAILSGPVEQFAPTAEAPRLSSTTAAVFASVPYKVLPSASKVIVTITGRSQHSFAAIKAALLS